YVLRPPRPTQGLHQLDVTQSGGLFGAQGRTQLGFQGDTTPPSVTLAGPIVQRAWPADRVTLRGSGRGAARVWIGGRPRALEGTRSPGGMVSPPAQLWIVAIDAAGNRSVQFAPVDVKPRLPAEPVRGVHMTADSWANAGLRKGVLAMIAAHEINTVELDVKDESGVVGFDPDIPWARKIGAAQSIYDLR